MNSASKCQLGLDYDKTSNELVLIDFDRDKRYTVSQELCQEYTIHTSNSGWSVVVWVTSGFKIKYLLLSDDAIKKLSQDAIDKTEKIEIADEYIHREGEIVVSWLNDEEFIIAFENQFSQIAYVIGNINNENTKSYVDADDKRLARSVMHSPRIVFDKFHRCWLIFIDTFRRAVMGCRWLGDRFGKVIVIGTIKKPTVRWEEIFRKIEKFDVTETDNKTAITVFASDNLSSEHYLEIKDVLRVDKKFKTLMFDLAEFANIRGFAQRFFPAKKHSQNPIFTPSDNLPFESLRVFNFGRVIKESNGHFRMWYSAMGKPKPGDHRWWNWLKIGHAISEDGLHWIRKGISDNGSHLMEGLPYMPALFIDEADSSFPYKILSFDTSLQQLELISAGKYPKDSNIILGTLWRSSDGFNWQSERVSLFFGDLPRPLSFVPQCVIRIGDKWCAYGFSSLTLGRRACAMAYSDDLKNWQFYEDNPVLPSELRGTPLVLQGPESQIHDTVVWQYEGWYVAFYQYQYGPDQHDVELALSRDGKSFQFLSVGNKLISRGDAGQWDRGSIIPTVPLITDDVIRIYYGGSNYYHPSDGEYTYQRSDNMKVACGLAELRLDGFAAVELPADCNGTMITVPIELKSKTNYKIYLNADCGKDGKIIAELSDLSGKPISGYSADDCIPIVGNSTKQPVSWKSKSSISPDAMFQIKLSGFAGSEPLNIYSIMIAEE